jgi:hypothetical protein
MKSLQPILLMASEVPDFTGEEHLVYLQEVVRLIK